jgi:hypothetical protein
MRALEVHEREEGDEALFRVFGASSLTVEPKVGGRENGDAKLTRQPADEGKLDDGKSSEGTT